MRVAQRRRLVLPQKAVIATWTRILWIDEQVRYGVGFCWNPGRCGGTLVFLPFANRAAPLVADDDNPVWQFKGWLFASRPLQLNSVGK